MIKGKKMSVNTIYGLSPREIEIELEVQLKEELLDDNSSLNLYNFIKGESISKDEILYQLRTFYISVKVKDAEYDRHCHIGWADGISVRDNSVNFSVDYERFINIAIEHFDLKVIEPCTADEFYGLACKDFLMGHFEDKEVVNLTIEVQHAKDAKDFKKRVLGLMKDNLAYWKKDANGGGTGMSQDGFSSWYHGSLFVNDFKVDGSMHDTVCDYKGVNEVPVVFSKSNYWETLYDFLLKKSGATLF
jgi:hypothetical protein